MARRLVAILAADAVGYSRLMGEDEAGTHSALMAHRREHIDPQIDGHHGRVVKSTGDGVLAEFASVVDAVGCAVAIQGGMAERNAGVAEDRRIAFRIGINLGDVIVEDGDIYGDGVNVAARLEALAEPGGICVSAKVRDEIKGKLDIGFEDLGPQQVKNMPDPVHSFHLRTTDTGDPSGRASPSPMALPDKPSIAVLPFANLSGDPEQNFFADGIAEDLITILSRIRWLFVTARSSTFTYRGRAVDVKQIGREMGVRYVVEGSVRRSGQRVRVTAQLVDATTGNHVWADRYDRELPDIFDLQDEITLTIATAIEPELGLAERERVKRKPPESLNAWESFQRGLWYLFQFSEAENATARGLLEKAVAMDPNFAPAYAYIGYTHFLDVMFDYAESRDRSLERAGEAASRAIAIDPREPMGHTILGRVLGGQRDYETAIAELDSAIRLNPNLAHAHYGRAAVSVWTGKPEEALGGLEMARKLSPHDSLMWSIDFYTACARIEIGDYETAVTVAKRATQQPYATFWPRAALASALGNAGRIEEARRELDRLLFVKPDFPNFFDERAAFWLAEAHRPFGDGLRKAGLGSGSAGSG